MVEFLKASCEDYAELVDEANRIFTEKKEDGYSYDSTYFQELLPKLYGDPSRMPEHYIAREDGKIVAEVGAFHCPVNVCGTVIENRGIGTVGVDSSCRGKGYMIKLMNMAAEDMKNEGVAFSALGGLRFRYEHFGYYPTGMAALYSYGADCRKYLYGNTDSHGISFRKAGKDDDMSIVETLYNKKSIHAVRPSDRFYDTLITWKNEVYLIEKDGQTIGYAVKTRGGTICELELTDDSILSDVVDALSITFDSHISLELDTFDTEKNRIMAEICNYFSLQCSEQMRIFSHKKTIDAYLRAKVEATDLADGVFRVNIADREKLCVEVSGGVPSVTDLKGKEDVFLTEKEAAMMLYGPYPTVRKDIPSWFPLPVFVASSDKV